MPAHLPLHDLHVAAGAKLEAVGDWELPLAYGDASAEYAAVRADAGVADRSHHGVVEITGRDRATFLHALLSNDVKSLGPGQGCAATLLDIHGKVQVVVVVWVLEDRILLITPPGMAPATLEALDRYLFSEKAALRDASGEASLLLLAGPRAPAIVERLAGVAPADAAWSSVAAVVDGVSLRLVRGAGETGEPEVWLAVPAADGGRVWTALIAGGARPVGLTALESLRVEAGTPAFGHDVDPSILLPEIPFANLVSYTKGCYPGQEVVVRIRDRGHVNRRLVGLTIEGDVVPAPGAGVLAGNAAAGKVTSAVFSLGLGRPIALALVRRPHDEAGTAVVVEAGDARIAATVSALPFSR